MSDEIFAGLPEIAESNTEWSLQIGSGSVPVTSKADVIAETSQQSVDSAQLKGAEGQWYNLNLVEGTLAGQGGPGVNAQRIPPAM